MPIIAKKKLMRYPISQHQHLSVTLRFLASGNIYLKFLTTISPQTIGNKRNYNIVVKNCIKVRKSN